MELSNGTVVGAFNGTVETTFLGFYSVNVSLVLTNSTIARRHIVRLDGDIYYFDQSQCASPDRDWASILHHTIAALLCLASFLLQLSLFRPFWRMATSRGPAFYILLNLLFCSSANLMLFVFLLYVEGIIGFRLPIPFNADYYIKQWPSRGETVFYFLYVLNRCCALIFPFRYSSWFKTRNVLWLIGLGWFYCLVDRIEWFLANKGMNMVHCLAPGDALDDGYQPYQVVFHPWMADAEWVSRKIYFFVWYGPMLMDTLTLLKLFYDKYTLQPRMPWLVKRPAMDRILEGRSERIRLFMVCLATTIYHFFWANLVGGYGQFAVPMSWYNYSYMLENVIPFLLMLWFSRDVRAQWVQSTFSVCGLRISGGSRVVPMNSSEMYPRNE